jgi:two-component system LytT family response regulator
MSQQFKAIVIDDEPAARRSLRSMLSSHADYIVIMAEATNGADAIRMINELRPDIVFLDIQMPDLTGFEVLEQINYQPNVIFTTAYEQYAIRAFESFSVDYLLKPVREERLQLSLQKLKQFGKTAFVPSFEGLRDLVKAFSSPRKPTAFPVKLGEKILLMRFENISYFRADDKYVFLHTIDGKKYLTDYTLSTLETKLPEGFLRVQKSYIINREKVGQLHKHFNGRYIITMLDSAATRLQTGLTYSASVKEVFDI